MRAPRYNFPDHVRATTREMAARMLQEDTVAGTPQQLESWIDQTPEVKESLLRGGYGAEFTAGDLFPLLQAHLPQSARMAPPAEEPAPRAGAPATLSRAMRILLTLVGILLALAGTVWFLQGIGVLPGSFMTGQTEWAVYGATAFALGVALMAFARHRPRG